MIWGRPLAIVASTLAHIAAIAALLHVPGNAPAEPPPMLDLVMPTPPDAEPAKTPELEQATAPSPPEPATAEPPPTETATAQPPPPDAEPPPPDETASTAEPDPVEAPEPPLALAEAPAPEEPPPPPPPPAPPPPPRPVRAQPPRPAQPVATATAPAPAAPSPAPAAAAPLPPTWLGEISAALARHRTYPAALRAERATGVVLLRFTVDRAGHVTARRIERTSGHPELDRLALELLGKADPLPTPPNDVQGAQIELIVPVRYAVR